MRNSISDMRNEQDQRKADAHRNQTTVSEFAKLETGEMIFNAHWQPGTDKQMDFAENRIVRKPKQNQELFCACNGLKCAGICRELHLYRKRMANPKVAAKGAKITKSWAEKCPEAYTK